MKKQIIAAAAAAMICVGAIGGTFAYLTKTTGEVTNTFTVGNDVAITLDEAKVDLNGEVITGDDAERVAENQYKLMPGHTYVKDPTVHVDKDSETCYVFIHVTNGISGIEASDATIASQIAEKWTPVDGKDGYYYWTEGTVDPDGVNDKNLVVFNNFTVDSAKTFTDLEAVKNASITITACAVQADGFDSAADVVAAAALPSGF